MISVYRVLFIWLRIFSHGQKTDYKLQMDFVFSREPPQFTICPKMRDTQKTTTKRHLLSVSSKFQLVWLVVEAPIN